MSDRRTVENRVQVRVGSRYINVPDDLGIDPIRQISGWHLGADHPEPDTAGPRLRYGKRYAIHQQTMQERCDPIGESGEPVFLNFEPGWIASNLLNRDDDREPVADRVQALEFGRTACDLLAGCGVIPDLWYGIGWGDESDGEPGSPATVANDLAACSLAGGLPRVGINAYGRFSFEWQRELGRKAMRARALREAGGPRPVFFVSAKVDDGPDLTESECRDAFTAVGIAALHIDADVVVWDDPGAQGVPFPGSRAEMSVQVARAVYAGWRGVR